MRNFHKYGAKAVVICGIRFPSKGEGDRYLYLRECEREGLISDLRLQVVFHLLPPIYEPKVLTRGPRKGQTVNGRLLYHGVDYIADFVYRMPDGQDVTEDFKGVKTAVFKIKERMAVENGISIRVVKSPCEPVGIPGVHFPGCFQNVCVHKGNVPQKPGFVTLKGKPTLAC